MLRKTFSLDNWESGNVVQYENHWNVMTEKSFKIMKKSEKIESIFDHFFIYNLKITFEFIRPHVSHFQ